MLIATTWELLPNSTVFRDCMGAYLLDDADVRSDLMSGAARVLLGAAVLFASCADGRASPVAEALLRALRGTQASAVVLDLQTGAVLASAGAPRRQTPP